MMMGVLTLSSAFFSAEDELNNFKGTLLSISFQDNKGYKKQS